MDSKDKKNYGSPTKKQGEFLIKAEGEVSVADNSTRHQTLAGLRTKVCIRIQEIFKCPCVECWRTQHIRTSN